MDDIILLTLDCDGTITALGPGAEKLLGQPSTVLVGQPFRATLDVFSHAKAEVLLQKTIEQGGVTDWELNHVRSGRAPVLISYSTVLLRNEHGEPIGVGAVGKDMTQTLELTARLAQSNQQLEGTLMQLEKAYVDLKETQAQLVQSEKMRALGQVVAGVAHEINNPAAFVANNLAHLARLVPTLITLFQTYQALKPKADPTEHEAIEAAEAAADIGYLWEDLPALVHESQEGMERIRTIVLSLRTFARLDEAEEKEASVNEGLQSTVRIVRALSKERIKISEDYEELPLIYCRPGELNQVFLNLLTNALQAIEGEGHIWVNTALVDETIIVTIRDTGQGMPQAVLDRLGEPFFTTKPVNTGTGLGLAVSFGIIQRHHGRLRFMSEPGRGTTAIVELPLPK